MVVCNIHVLAGKGAGWLFPNSLHVLIYILNSILNLDKRFQYLVSVIIVCNDEHLLDPGHRSIWRTPCQTKRTVGPVPTCVRRYFSGDRAVGLSKGGMPCRRYVGNET